MHIKREAAFVGKMMPSEIHYVGTILLTGSGCHIGGGGLGTSSRALDEVLPEEVPTESERQFF